MAAALYSHKTTKEAVEPIARKKKEKSTMSTATHMQPEVKSGSHVPTLAPIMADSYAGGFSEGIGMPLCILEIRLAANYIAAA